MLFCALSLHSFAWHVESLRQIEAVLWSRCACKHRSHDGTTELHIAQIFTSRWPVCFRYLRGRSLDLAIFPATDLVAGSCQFAPCLTICRWSWQRHGTRHGTGARHDRHTGIEPQDATPQEKAGKNSFPRMS